VAFPDAYAAMLLNPSANAENLPAGYWRKRWPDCRNASAPLPRRRLAGRHRGGALWTPRLIDRNRVPEAPELERIVVGVDPAVTGNASSDITGIVTAGRSRDGHYFVLSDASLRGRPTEWSAAVTSEYARFRADRVVGEVNNGGELVETVLRG
jgi:phage terminase large subunit-like protein